MRAIVLLAFISVGCVVGGEDAEYPPFTPPPELGAEQAPKRGTLFRDDVDAVVDAGLGRFLQRVDVEPALAGGRFEGFRIVELRPADWWQGVDLQPGDVVVRVNGLPIERETEAYDAFQTLKKSPKLRVAYRRSGVERELVLEIVPRAGAKPAPAPAPAKAAPKKPAGAARTTVSG